MVGNIGFFCFLGINIWMGILVIVVFWICVEKYWRVIIYYYMEFFNVGVDYGVCYSLFIIFIFVYGFGDILFRIRE